MYDYSLQNVNLEIRVRKIAVFGNQKGLASQYVSSILYLRYAFVQFKLAFSKTSPSSLQEHKISSRSPNIPDGTLKSTSPSLMVFCSCSCVTVIQLKRQPLASMPHGSKSQDFRWMALSNWINPVQLSLHQHKLCSSNNQYLIKTTS